MLAAGLMENNAKKTSDLRDRIIDGLSGIGGVLVTGPEPGPLRLPGLASFIIEGVDSETLVMDLSAKGICVSAGSACSSGTGKPSYVLRAMGYSEREAWSSLRVSLDNHITPNEVSELIQAVKSSIKAIRNQQ
jgi:cysteine desulfurase